MFFQDLPFWYVEHFANNRANQKVEGLDLLKEIFLRTFEHHAVDEWFRKELTKLTGITLDEIRFDKSKRYCLEDKGKFRCLFLTLEHMNSSEGTATIESFLGRSFELEKKNRGDKKWYGQAYKDFLSDVEFVDSYREKMSTSAVHKKFFGSTLTSN